MICHRIWQKHLHAHQCCLQMTLTGQESLCNQLEIKHLLQLIILHTGCIAVVLVLVLSVKQTLLWMIQRYEPFCNSTCHRILIGTYIGAEIVSLGIIIQILIMGFGEFCIIIVCSCFSVNQHRTNAKDAMRDAPSHNWQALYGDLASEKGDMAQQSSHTGPWIPSRATLQHGWEGASGNN